MREGRKADSTLVDVQKIHPGILVDLKYATADNFTRKKIYHFHRCFLQNKVAVALGKVQTKLESMNLGLKVWDGFRPPSAQRKLWEACPNERFVAHPSKGSCHSRGASVDVTLVTKDKKELLMPSAFDDFSEKACLHYKDAPEIALKHRDLLHRVMHEEGFLSYEWEWWHFNFQGWEQFPPITTFEFNIIR